MLMKDELLEAFNRQVTSELAASLAYLQMAAHFDAEELPGMAHWMRIQSSEEADHAERFIHFLIARGGRVAIGDIAAPTSRYGAPETVFEAALGHERKVTGEIRALYESATEHGDMESFPLLHEFLAEQVEEESTLETIISQLRRVGDSQPALLMIDRELGARSATG